MNARGLIALSLLLLAGCGGTAPEPVASPSPSVLVTTRPVVRGSLAATITAFGSAIPSVTGTRTLSVAQPGQVTALSVTPGATVRAGQTLLAFSTAPAARSGYAQAVTALAAARKQRDTTAQLLAQQLATRDQLVQADKAVVDAAQALSAQRADGADQARRTLSAPFDGVVTALPVAAGDRTQAGTALVTVARAGSIVVTVGVDPAERARLRIGQRAALRRLTGGGALAGRVLRIDGALNPRTRLVDIDLSFPTGAVLPGEAVRAEIEVGQVAGWVVPHAAVVTTGGPTRIFQVAGGKAKTVPVSIVIDRPDGDVVNGAIDPDEPIIVTGAYQVGDGDAVRTGRR